MRKSTGTITAIGVTLIVLLGVGGFFLSRDITPPVQKIEKAIDNARFKK